MCLVDALNLFTGKEGKIHDSYCTELLSDPGSRARRADMIWPVWSLVDYTRDERGTDWHPKEPYEA